VLVYDARHGAVTARGAPVLGASDLRLHVLPAGSTFDPTWDWRRCPTERRQRPPSASAGTDPAVPPSTFSEEVGWHGSGR
jgi:hypothetical protein